MVVRSLLGAPASIGTLFMVGRCLLDQHFSVFSDYNAQGGPTGTIDMIFPTPSYEFDHNTITNDQDYFTPDEMYTMSPYVWRRWLSRHSVQGITLSSRPSLVEDGCGIAMKVDFSANNTSNNASPPRMAYFKSMHTNMSHYDAESHLREVKAFYLDRILGCNVVLPTVGHRFRPGDLPVTRRQKKSLKKRYRENRSKNNVYCNATSSYTKSEVSGSLMIWLNGTEQTSWEQMLSGPFSSKYDPTHHLGIYRESAINYVVFHYLGACMKSNHNHFLYRPQNRFTSIDNDRCLTPESISSGENVPSVHAQRIKQWKEMILNICDFSPSLVRLVQDVRRPGSLPISQRLRTALAEDVLSKELLESQPEAFDEIDKRFEILADHIDKCLLANQAAT